MASIVLTFATRASDIHLANKSASIMQRLHAATVMTVNGESEEVPYSPDFRKARKKQA